MKYARPAKYLSISVLALGLVVGCAGQPKQEAAEAVQPAGPSAAVTQALDSARAAIKDAKALDWIWRDTGKFLKQAEAAAKAGDEAKAIKLANKARDQARLAVNQYYLEQAKTLLGKLRNMSGLSAEQKQALEAGTAAVLAAEGKRAYDILSKLEAELAAASIQYTVVKGDSLWAISGKPDIYNNPYQWPLIYKANSDKIKDADLIYPGQNFSIDRNPSAAEVDAAINHAKTRGAWSLGVVEESDRAYLGGLRVR
ncbi:LysM peptidoglycan-binding domain-containing protein [Thiohalobacter sp. IOR34]|uniref:LysM peptidoglycan-binding domain-containing protein n=1 Tax=Thiohalobacter sp. IOR34 TaxID=3057176 RepID=UPI0025AFDE42|nr:LysM peptidoglycan-binding domain-containing protein [Thiohalobacter sp. IOR34]WJW76071.1 LysM peptidoglycan-binding domain-containing protein [Thiohalobacter sp. IOR34]